MAFQKDTFNDFQMFEDASENRSLDVSGIMLDKDLKILDHHKAMPMNDIVRTTPEALETLDCTEQKYIRIRKNKTAKTTEDITLPERGGFPILNPLRKYRNIKMRTISIIEPLPKLPSETLDIRALEYIPRKKHADIYVAHYSVRKNFLKYTKKHKKTIHKVGKRSAKIGIVLGIVTVSVAVFALGLKNYIQSSTTEQYQKLLALKSTRDPALIKEGGENIRSQFARLGILFAPIDLAFNNSFYSNDSVKLAHNVIYGGREVAEMTALLGNLLQSGKEFAAANQPNVQLTNGTGAIMKLSQFKLTDFLRDNQEDLLLFQEHLNNTVHYYGEIKSLGNPDLDAKFSQGFEMLYNAKKYTDFFLANFDDILYALGDTKPERYVILNQNRDEIRASGGFPGSVITIELYKGAIQKYDKKDVYYYDWHLYPYKETPPEGLNKLSTNYGLRDANYYPEFSKSLEKVNFFYEKAGGGSIDTLIAINQGFVIDLLKKYGSVHLKEINADVTADNFSELMSVLVENKLGAKISPKDILFRFTEELEKNLMEKKDFIGYVDLFLKEIDDGEVLIASRDDTIKKFITTNTTQEKWKTNTGNWFYPIFTSLSGNKSDRYVKRTFETESLSLSGCLVQNTIHLSSTHPFGDTERVQIRQLFAQAGITDPKEQERLMQIQGNADNKQFVRFIVPKKASLNSQDQERSLLLDTSNPNYSVISFYFDTPLGKKSDETISYTVPVQDCSSNLQFFKQPGFVNYEFNHK